MLDTKNSNVVYKYKFFIGLNVYYPYKKIIIYVSTFFLSMLKYRENSNNIKVLICLQIRLFTAIIESNIIFISK